MKSNTKQTLSLFIGALLGLLATTSRADTLTLTLEASWNFNGAFGLAYDGSNLQVGTPSGVITEINTTTGLATGNTTTNPYGWSALAWSGTQLVASSGHSVRFFDRYTGANQSTVALVGGAGSYNLIDGLDVDNGGEIFWSSDVSPVNRYTSTGVLIQGSIPIPPGGGFSGVEFIHDSSLGDILVVVNDAYSPRRLSVARLDGSILAEATFANSRYEDLAFDGNFLYAADYYGNRIDKYGLSVGDVVIREGDGSSVPDNGSTLALLGSVFVGLAALRRRIVA